MTTGRTRKPAKAAQEGQEAQRMDVDIQEQEAAVGSIQEAAETRQEIIGPEDGAELLGCQEEAGLCEAALVEYVVTAEGGLRLREQPRLDAPILTVLPQDAGVFGIGPEQDGWREVITGRLVGWMMSKHLEALPGPYYGAG